MSNLSFSADAVKTDAPLRAIQRGFAGEGLGPAEPVRRSSGKIYAGQRAEGLDSIIGVTVSSAGVDQPAHYIGNGYNLVFTDPVLVSGIDYCLSQTKAKIAPLSDVVATTVIKLGRATSTTVLPINIQTIDLTGMANVLISYLDLVADDESAGAANVTLLQNALTARSVVYIGPGKYHFDGTAPILPTARFGIIGAGPAHHMFNLADTSITTLVWHGSGYFLDIQPTPLPITNANAYGPYEIRNLMLYSDETDGGFIRIGNEADTQTTNFQHRGLHIEGVGCNLAAQRWNNAFPLLFNSLLSGDPGASTEPTLDRTTERHPCIRIVKGQTATLQNVNCQGGFWGLHMTSMDRAVLQNVRCQGQVFPIMHKSIDTYTKLASVAGSWDVFVESPEGCGIWTDSGSMHNGRVECGYDRTRIGEYTTTPVTAWSITAGTGTINLTITGDAADYFEPDFPIKLTDSNGNTYWLLVTDVPTSTTLTFAHSDSQCYFAATTTGTTINRYFGFDLFAYGHRAEFGGAFQLGCNVAIPNMPLGFFMPTNGRMKCSGGVAGIGNTDETNRLQIIGHVAGKQHWLAGGVDYIGGNTELAPDHPLCNRRGGGWHDFDSRDWSQGPIDLVRPGEFWRFYPSHYATSANGESRECLLQYDSTDARWYEDLTNSSTGRHFRMYGLDGATNISADYRVRLKSNTGSPVANVEIKETGAGENAVLATIASVTTSWAWYTGSFTTTVYTGTGTVPQIHINSPNVLFSEFEITRTYP